ncbi:MAG: parB [Chlamydiales bacterium]|jgi:ParB family chromosome partitioning protein|nr:parB [Chlamydiales bacterium]
MAQSKLQYIPVNAIVANPAQPRRYFTEDELQELAESLRYAGFIHPPTVRPLKDSNKYELIAGERRWRAAQLAKLEIIPVFIIETSSLISAELALIENVQRVDLNPLEIALALKALSEEQGLDQQELAKRIGKSRSTIANYLRLLALPLPIQEKLQANTITMGHAKAILSISGEQEQYLMMTQIINNGLSVRQAEKLANQINQNQQNSLPNTRPFTLNRWETDTSILQEYAKKIEYALGTKVEIRPLDKEKGTIYIDYYSLDDFEHILSKIGINHED